MRIRLSGILIVGLAAAILPLPGQTAVTVQKTELAVPFGVAAGRLVTVGEFLLFLDDDKPEASFAVAHDNVRSLTVDGDTMALETAKPVRDRSGERSRLNFRLSAVAEAPKLLTWFKSGPPAAPAPAKEDAAVVTFNVKHDHFRGSCSGRLILEQDRLVFESITDLNHSRQWSLKDIKELKRDNPYAIKVIPFSGDTYNFEIEGKGMDSEVYRGLVDRVTAARLK